ncbi:TonB-dependent receptor [Flavobacterium psychrophilum]|uniref:TonB-dependent receptor n=1 Tax=Flavobacterium psychrophilum TaxID=96345 RepID=UPI0004E7CD26|nr:TonB-dependent receptor [Flavobacterium psychrophilum]AIJ38021.1 Ferric aerobactin receptor precursor [Flavobacterium psychrophilum]AIN71766.1 TonB-dependent receptor [Flavobacterium psychrophilum FPG101]EKT3957357.1 TonB-dependent receptor [Flavobacterium psychrophilum]EKT3974612.1 TonB-dependent receptor [Flavobacterium psychrophilum]EKT4497753.1 TonB-dependent receptor [Flavobacterium psychrophilum]
MSKTKLAVLIVLSIIGGTTAKAQSIKDTIKGQVLDEVVIVSSRVPKHIADIPGTVWVIDDVKLQKQIKGGATLNEALGILIPSLDIGNQGRTNYSQNMRGRNVLVMLNGVSLNSARATSRQLDAINPFNIERIEVLSGASAVYGGDATGGVINIITKKSTSKKVAFETSLRAKSGLNNKNDHDVAIAQSIEGGNDFVKGRIGVAYSQNAGAFDANKNQVITDVKQSDFQYGQSIDVLGSFDFKLSDNQDINLDVQHYISKVRNDKWLFFGVNYAGIKNSDLIAVKDGAHSDIVPSTTRSMVNLQYNLRNIFGGQNLMFQAFGRTEKVDFGASFAEGVPSSAPIVIPPFLSSLRIDTDVYGLKAVLYKKWDALSITYGIDADQDKLSNDQSIYNPKTSAETGGLVNNIDAFVGRYPKTEITNLSGFAQADWNVLDKLTLSGGIRQQHTNVKLDDFAGFKEQVYMHFGYGNSIDLIKGGQSNYNVTLFNASALYKFNKKQQVWFNFSQGFAVPDAAKSYGFGKYKLNGNHWDLLNSVNVSESPLSGVKTDQLELGFRHLSRDGFYAQGSVFYAISNKTLAIDKVGFTISLLDQKLRNIGFEGALGYRMQNGFEVGGNVLLMASETETKKDGWQNQTVYTNNPSKFMAFVGWNEKVFSARLQGQHSMNYTDLAHNTINGFTLFDLMGDVKLPKGVLNFGIQNLLNRDYTTLWGQRSVFFYGIPKAFGYLGRGRTFSLGYTIKF